MSPTVTEAPTRPTPIDRLRRLEELGPRRLTGTATEKAAQVVLGDELQALGFSLDWRPFRYGQSLYASLMLHFGLAAVATGVGLVAPSVGAALHLLAGVSYALESMRKALVLRSLLPTVASQNLLATLPAKAPLRRRLVLIAHADAAYTGVLFTPALIRAFTKQPPRGLGWFKKQLGLATLLVLVLAVLEGLDAAGVWSAPLALRVALSLPALLAGLLNLDVVLRNHVVPGAADNLSGCTACLELAWRLRGRLPDDVELVIVISGAEEAGTGGALRLSQQLAKSGEWTPAETIVLGIDTLSNGDLYYLEEGELWPVPVTPALEAAVIAENQAKPELPPVKKYVIPVGASDGLPFLLKGFPTLSLTCIDPTLGSPRHYHHPTDTWRNVDVAQLDASIDFAERLVLRLARTG